MKIKPPCQQCTNAGQPCYRKTQGPGCWRCSQWKIGCSIVEARKKGKGKEAEVIRVQRTEKRGEETVGGVEGNLEENGEGSRVGGRLD